PDDQAPGAAGDVLQHEPRQRADGDGDDEKVRPQVGAVELVRSGGEEAGGAHRGPHYARDERAGAPLPEVGPQLRGNAVIHGVGHHLAPPSRPRAAPSSWPRAAAGTSSMEACWLSCSARM